MAENQALTTTGGQQKTLMQLLEGETMKNQFAMALPKHCKIDRFMRMALTCVRKNPKLLACTKESVFACLMDCSQYGIEPDGRRAHLIPYGTECKLILDYKGLAELVMRSGLVSTLHADIVCENDTFEFSYGTGGGLRHVPCLRGDRGKPFGAYSYAKMKDGSESYEFMTESDIMKIKARSPGARKPDSPWNHEQDQYEMWKKTPFRRHCKWLPLSAEIRDAVAKDEEADTIDAEFVDHGAGQAAAVTTQGRLPRLQDGKSVSAGRPAATIPPKHDPQELDEEPKEDKKPESAPEPAVHGGLTGATRPLGAAGTKKRTLANPGA